jgi:hypothetical protein
LATTGTGSWKVWSVPLSAAVALRTVAKSAGAVPVVETSTAKSRTRWSNEPSDRGCTWTLSIVCTPVSAIVAKWPGAAPLVAHGQLMTSSSICQGSWAPQQ